MRAPVVKRLVILRSGNLNGQTARVRNLCEFPLCLLTLIIFIK